MSNKTKVITNERFNISTLLFFAARMEVHSFTVVLVASPVFVIQLLASSLHGESWVIPDQPGKEAVVTNSSGDPGQ